MKLWRGISLVLVLGLVVSTLGADTISMQGRLVTREGVPLASGIYNMRFALFNVADGGAGLWSETHSADSAVTVTAGLYCAELGGNNVFPVNLFSANADLWLEMAVDTNRNGGFEPDETFMPRVKLARVPLAQEARNAKMLDGKGSAEFLLVAQKAADSDLLDGLDSQAFASATHDHDVRYYLKSEVDSALAGKSDVGHVHDGADIMSGTVAETRIDAAVARDAEVSAEIAAHAGIADAHHPWPLTDAEIPNDITILLAQEATTATYAQMAGSVSGPVNADTLDGKDSADFALALHSHDATDIISGELPDSRITNSLTVSSAGSVDGGAIKSGTVPEARIDGAIARDAEVSTQISSHAAVASAHHAWPLTDASVPDNITISSAGSVDGGAIKSGTVAEARIASSVARDSEIMPTVLANDGSGSGLDADKLDGRDSAELGEAYFEAIVAPSGGDYTTIQAALAAGKKTIFVRNGTYTLASGIDVTSSGTVIIGESRDGVILDGSPIRASSDSAGYYTGTVSVSSGSSTVTGSGTLWLGNVVPGQFICLGRHWYEIGSVDSNTQLTLVKKYYGVALNDVDCWIESMLPNIRLENLTVQNCPLEPAITFIFVLNGSIANCAAKDSASGIRLGASYDCRISKNFCSDNYSPNDFDSNGIFLESGGCNTVQENTCNNNAELGIFVWGGQDNSIVGNSCNNCNSGIWLFQSSNNTLSANSCNDNVNFGIGLHESLRNCVNANACENNGYDGIVLSGSDTNSVSGNSCNYNARYGVGLLGSNSNSAGNNICSNNTLKGIYISGSELNAVLGNAVTNNGDNGVHLYATVGNVVVSNASTGNTGYGVEIYGQDNIVGMNMLSGNTSGAGFDGGTSTTQKATNYPPIP